MEERVKTSFIPKASLQVEQKRASAKNPMALANIIAAAVLIVAILGAAGIFFYERFTVASIDSKKQSLERSRSAFEPATIKELSRLNTRIETGKKLLKVHLSLSNLFDELERRTLASVKFNDFSYTVGDQTRVLLTASGEAASFNAVALQSDAFSKSALITEPIFSNVNISKNGTIQFNFSAVIDVSRLYYSGSAVTAPPSSGTTTPTL